MTALAMVLALSGPAVIVAILLAVLIIKRKAQDRRAVELLLAAVKAAEPAYREQLLAKLGAGGHADPDKLAALVDKLIKGRRQYFKQVLAALLDRKPTGLVAIEPALQQYSELHVQAMAVLARAPVSAAPVAASASPSGAAGPAAVESHLRSENERLKREVGLTLSALNNIFAEYASMFGDEHTRRDMNLEEILSSMQQLAAGEPPVPVDEPLPPSTGGNAPDSEADFATTDAPESALPDTDVNADSGADSDAVSDTEAAIASDPFAEPPAAEAADNALTKTATESR
ncbi:MAG TPA: hypothetical protein VFV64_09860 [Permianibacter sp.]|nr:hypothetical protein [Permianibacter sp.]